MGIRLALSGSIENALPKRGGGTHHDFTYTRPLLQSHRDLEKELIHLGKECLRGHFKTGHTGSLQKRPCGKVPGPRCCTLPSAFRASLISEIWRVEAYILLGGQKNLV